MFLSRHASVASRATDMKKPCTILATADLKTPGYGADEECVCELDPEDAPNGHAKP